MDNKTRRNFAYTALAILSVPILLFSLLVVREFQGLSIVSEHYERDLSKADLDYYYLSLAGKYVDESYVFDQGGIPVFFFKGNRFYHPVSIIQFALGAHEQYLKTNDIKARDAFLKCADWLKDNLRKDGDFYYWEYNFRWEGIDKVPWYSAMAQGEGASLLLRAFSETKRRDYLYAARLALLPLLSDLSSGGASVVRGTDYIFPQEYVVDPPFYVLNGAITASFGVYDYYRVTGDREMKRAFESMASTFASALDQYDTGYWSLYSRRPGNLADPHYHSVHIAQYRVLYLITGDKRFLMYSQKFRQYQDSYSDKVRYIFENYLRRARSLKVDDIGGRIPDFIRRKLLGSKFALRLWA